MSTLPLEIVYGGPSSFLYMGVCWGGGDAYRTPVGGVGGGVRSLQGVPGVAAASQHDPGGIQVHLLLGGNNKRVVVFDINLSIPCLSGAFRLDLYLFVA